MPSGLIFITGATGFIGSAVAAEALDKGYRLRISVRRESQIPELKTLFPQYEDRIDFAVVADITQESSFAGKLDGVDYVFHLASPLAGDTKESYFVPAVKGTTAILEAATKVESIKRVVITSSIAALIPVSGIPNGGVIKENNDWDFSVNQDSDFTGSNDRETSLNIYRASKLLANNATWEFMKDRKPNFSLVTLHPAFVFGHNLRQTTEQIDGSNRILFGTIMTGSPVGTITGVHIKDVAEAHVKALNSAVPGGSKFLLAGPKASWRDVATIVKESYPQSGFGIKEDISGESWPVDTTQAEKALGMKWRSLKEIVIDVVDQQLQFRKAKSS